MNILKLIRIFATSALMVGILGCNSLPIMHDNAADKTIPVWEQTLSKEALKINLLWAKPISKGPLPTIVVHHGMLQENEDMRGVLIDLANQGFLSVAVNYDRLIGGEWKKATMPIREKKEIDFIMDTLTGNPWVDKDNIGLLGYSLGGAHSLKIAENNPLIKTVVVYYPMTDFVGWAKSSENDFILSIVANQIKSSYLAESVDHTSASHFDLARNYSAVNFANEIEASVLVIHGDKDKIAPIEYSQKFVALLQSSGNEHSTLMVMKDDTHGFNFKRNEGALKSWFTSLAWMKKHLVVRSAEQQLLAANTETTY